MYVLKRVEDGKFVAMKGMEHSYCTNLQHARLYKTKEAAIRDACGNESVYSVGECLKGGWDR